MIIGIVLLIKNINGDSDPSKFKILDPNSIYSNILDSSINGLYAMTPNRSTFSMFIVPFDHYNDIKKRESIHVIQRSIELFPSCAQSIICAVSIIEFKRKYKPYLIIVNNNVEDQVYLKLQHLNITKW